MRKLKSVEILVVGGGTSGVCAAIQAARLGQKVLLVEETPWLGGMLTAAGVSAIDGNHLLPSGLWGEFRQHLYEYYGGPAKVETGWVSHTLFEPRVGNALLKTMVAPYPNLEVIHGFWPAAVTKQKNKITAVTFKNSSGEQLNVQAHITIEATECGDIIALAGIPYSLGRESKSMTGESAAPEIADDLIQDLTYVAILKDYGDSQDKTIPCPPDYNPDNYRCTCRELCDDPAPSIVDAKKMLDYGRLPNHKIMVNWPLHGNDYFLNLIEMKPEQRSQMSQHAKNFTLGWIHFIQTRGGFSNLGLAEDEFPTPDRLPFIPYHRESRRIEGIIKLTVNDLLNPYADVNRQLYKTGIAVGDYPLDHHHSRSPKAVNEHFPKIPSFSVPYGCLVPKIMDGILIAEKSISVTHIVNGTTRLQPCVMLIGQAAGAAAALSCGNNLEPREINIRQLQQTLLDAGCWCLPFLDLSPADIFFQAIQRIGLSGVMRGEGIPGEWMNETRFYPDQEISGQDFFDAFIRIWPALEAVPLLTQVRDQKVVFSSTFLQVISLFLSPEHYALNDRSPYPDIIETVRNFLKTGRNDRLFHPIWSEPGKPLSRKLLAYLLDSIFQPFQRLSVSISK